MKILFMNSWYYPNMKGGAEQSTKLLAEKLVEFGHNVAVLTADGIQNMNFCQEPEKINGVIVFRSKTHLMRIPNNIMRKIAIKCRNLKNRKIKKDFEYVVGSFRPDVIHTNSMSGLSFYVWKLASELGIPIIHTLRDYSVCSPRGIYEDINSTRFPYNHFLRFYTSVSRKYTNFVSYVTAPSDFTLNLIHSSKFFNHIKRNCIANAIDFDLNDTKRIIENRRNKNRETMTTFIFAGRLMEIKGIKLLIEAFKKVDNDKTKLLICGEGELKDFVLEAEKTDSRIIYCGQLTKESLEMRYKEADIAIFPSQWDEPFGRVVIEANKFGLPVIASDRGGIPEIINTVGGGILFSTNSVDNLIDAINNMTSSNLSCFYDNIIKNLKEYSLEMQAMKFVELYCELLE